MPPNELDRWRQRRESEIEDAWQALIGMVRKGYSIADTLDAIEEHNGTSVRMACERRVEAILKEGGQS